jgi:hypothetical protein
MMDERLSTQRIAATPSFIPASAGVLQRKCDCGQHTIAGGGCGECTKEGSLQSYARNSEFGSRSSEGVPPIVHEVLNSPGQPLDATTRAFFEPRFGHDFSRVPTNAGTAPAIPARLAIGAPHDQFEQEADALADLVTRTSALPNASPYDFSNVLIHTDERAAESARQINAQAFTVGNHIVFDRGEYAPHTATGQRLLAHELAHVVQQTGQTAIGNAQRGFIAQHSAAPRLQAKWRLASVTAGNAVEKTYTRENGEAESFPVSGGQMNGGVVGHAKAWQEQGLVHQQVGGEAQVAEWMTRHYIFKNDAGDGDFLQLSMVGQLAGNAKAEDLRYARSAAVVWGRITERTTNNPTPPSQQLFEIQGGGISAATVGDLGVIEAEIPIGEKGSVKITIPLKKVDEGTFVPFNKSTQPTHDVSGAVDEVDVVLGARAEAAADIETAFFGVSPWISQNENKAEANGLFALGWTSRPAPGSDSKRADPAAEAQKDKLRFPGDCKRNTLINAANKDGCSTREGGSHTVVSKNGNQITTIPRDVKENNTCRSIIKILNQECLQ